MWGKNEILALNKDCKLYRNRDQVAAIHSCPRHTYYNGELNNGTLQHFYSEVFYLEGEKGSTIPSTQGVQWNQSLHHLSHNSCGHWKVKQLLCRYNAIYSSANKCSCAGQEKQSCKLLLRVTCINTIRKQNSQNHFKRIHCLL